MAPSLNAVHSAVSDGFTIMELVIAMAIVGVLAGLSLTGFEHYQRRELRLEGNELVQRIATTQLRYRDRYGRFASDAELSRFNEELTSERFTIRVRPVAGFEFQQYDASLGLKDTYVPRDPACVLYEMAVRGGVVRSSAKDSTGADATRKCLGL
ncbi:MAG TPA: prepilin-type N-terminal cleavage/methylation domain-containing protein [Limnobacter sp.]|nr:prepilin-type N-terminal cleavage/methylation domain-containing protein [Limnobacter sp.]